MNCRYCSGVYAATERTCGGCGAPKTAVQTLLDVPAAPGHWSHSMMDTVQWVAIISGGVAAGAVLLSMIGFKGLGGLITFFWIIPGSPGVLALGAWQSSIGKVGERLRNFFIAGLLWIGVTIAMLLVIGLTAVS